MAGPEGPQGPAGSGAAESVNDNAIDTVWTLADVQRIHGITLSGDYLLFAEQQGLGRVQRVFVFDKATGAIARQHDIDSALRTDLITRKTGDISSESAGIDHIEYHEPSDTAFLYVGITGASGSQGITAVYRLDDVTTESPTLSFVAGRTYADSRAAAMVQNNAMSMHGNRLFFILPDQSLTTQFTYFWTDVADDGTIALQNHSLTATANFDFHAAQLIGRSSFITTDAAGTGFAQTNDRIILVEGYESEDDCVVTRFLRSDICLLYTSPSPRDRQKSRMPSSA